MGRARKQHARDKNKQTLPQTPRREIATSNEDLEIAKEVDELYELKARPGHPPTEVIRKDEE